MSTLHEVEVTKLPSQIVPPVCYPSILASGIELLPRVDEIGMLDMARYISLHPQRCQLVLAAKTSPTIITLTSFVVEL
jgi:hypothetical protein